LDPFFGKGLLNCRVSEQIIRNLPGQPMTKPVSPQQISRSSKHLAVAFCAALIWLCLILILTLNQNAVKQAFVPRDDDIFARQFIESIRVGNYDEARLHLDHTLQGENIDKGFRFVHDILAKGDVLKIEVAGFKVTPSGRDRSDERRTDLYYQLHFQNYWAGGDVFVDTQNGTSSIIGFHFHQIPDSVVVWDQFSLQDKSISHYIVLACCIIIPFFMLYSLVVCMGTRIRRKWLWIIFILSGLMQIDFNWATGTWSLKPLAILFLGSAFIAGGPEAPWVLEFGLPVGAFIFWVYQKGLLKPAVTKRGISRAGG
jgi:uncharacterized integral membrane protein